MNTNSSARYPVLDSRLTTEGMLRQYDWAEEKFRKIRKWEEFREKLGFLTKFAHTKWLAPL
jgi:hypothetical protein